MKAEKLYLTLQRGPLFWQASLSQSKRGADKPVWRSIHASNAQLPVFDALIWASGQSVFEVEMGETVYRWGLGVRRWVADNEAVDPIGIKMLSLAFGEPDPAVKRNSK